MAITRTFLGVTVSSDGTPFTTMSVNGLDLTGFTHAVIFTKHEGAAITITPSDNRGSTPWTSYNKKTHSNTDFHGQLHSVKLTSPGSGTNFTMTVATSRTWGMIVVWGVNAGTGEAALDVEAAGGEGTSTAPDAGSLATTAATVSFMGVGEYSGATYTASSGWTEDVDNSGYAASRADASGTLDPAATASGSIPWVAVAISLKESAGGGAKKKVMLPGLLMQRALRV